jgi:hypothetical protein
MPHQAIFKNELPEASSLHWHGFEDQSGYDVMPGISQESVRHGQSFTYNFLIKATGPSDRSSPDPIVGYSGHHIRGGEYHGAQRAPKVSAWRPQPETGAQAGAAVLAYAVGRFLTGPLSD